MINQTFVLHCNKPAELRASSVAGSALPHSYQTTRLFSRSCLIPVLNSQSVFPLLTILVRLRLFTQTIPQHDSVWLCEWSKMQFPMDFDSDRIVELLAPFLGGRELGDKQLQSLRTYLDLLIRWNSKINLTAVRSPEEIITRHFGESLFAATQLFPEPVPNSVVDIGSGAGLPGIPIKIWNDAVELILIESNQKKGVFLREIARALNLKQVSVLSARAETSASRANVVTLRAVEHFEQVLPIARQLLALGGRLALLIGEAQTQVAHARLPDLNWQKPIPIPMSSGRVVLVGIS